MKNKFHTDGCKFLSFDMVLVIKIVSKKSLGLKLIFDIAKDLSTLKVFS